MVVDIPKMQAAIAAFGCDGWLLYDFRGNNPLARRVLRWDEATVGSRRVFYAIPARGTSRKLVHRIESAVLDHLPGDKRVYLKWQELEEGVRQLVDGMRTVAMEYSPNNANPYISRVDGGTLELVRRFGVEVVSSGDLIQQFEAVWDTEQWELHQQAARQTDAAFQRAWATIRRGVRERDPGLTELSVQRAILDHFAEQGLVTDHPPIVAVGPHSGDPHFEPASHHDTRIERDQFVLIDLWARLDRPAAVYSDLTRVAWTGERVPARVEEVFHIVASARDAAIETVRNAFGRGRPLAGWEVDQAAREVIEAAGYGEAFIHRTGHSIGQETHGNGAHMDNLEMRDERRVLPGTCFSIEPGIYLPEFGIRSEVNVFVDWDGGVHVTGGELQTSVRALLDESREDP